MSEDPKAAPEPDKQDDERTWTETIEVAGDQLMQKVKELAAESSVRRIRIREPDGDVAVDIPLTVGAAIGGVTVLAAPLLAIVGAIAAFVSKVTIEIVHDETKGPEETAEAAPAEAPGDAPAEPTDPAAPSDPPA